MVPESYRPHLLLGISGCGGDVCLQKGLALASDEA